jgi:hypothetical protein
VTAVGSPAPTLSESGALPAGVTFNAATGVLGGTPAAGAGGSYNLTFTAGNGIGTPAVQAFTLTVNQAAAITSDSGTTFIAGMAGTFTVRAVGFPTPTLSESGALPAGITFNAATGVLGGTPAADAGGTYNLTFGARNGVGTVATQGFTLTVGRPPGVGPVILGIEQVSSPRINPVSTITVDLSEAITPSTFTESNMSLTRDGIPLSLAGSTVTETQSPGSTTSFLISGLDSLTSMPGNYVLTISAASFRDRDGDGGLGSRSISFVVEPIAPPAIKGVPQGRFITVSFGESLDSTRAVNLDDYVILPLHSGRPRSAGNIVVIAASYDSSSRSVTLTTDRKLMPKQSYLLEIIGSPPGGLVDSSGAPLGDHYVLILPAQAAKSPNTHHRHASPTGIDAHPSVGKRIASPRRIPHHRP